MVISLAACAPVHDPPPGAPVEFSRDVVKAWHKHRRDHIPRYFLVSEDGKSSLSVFTRLLDCRLSEPFSKWQNICERRSHQECHRYSRLGSPRWQITIADDDDEASDGKNNDDSDTGKKPVQITREAICFPRQILFYPDHSRYYRHLLD